MMNQDDAQLRLMIDARTREWEAKFRQMQEQIARKDEQIEQTRNRVEIGAYIQRRISEERDLVAPELIDYIGGSSVEQVEAAISTAKAKTASILAGIREATFRTDVPVPAAIPAQQQPQGGQQQPSAQDIAAIEPGSPEHMALRAAFGLDKARGRGLYG